MKWLGPIKIEKIEREMKEALSDWLEVILGLRGAIFRMSFLVLRS